MMPKEWCWATIKPQNPKKLIMVLLFQTFSTSLTLITGSRTSLEHALCVTQTKAQPWIQKKVDNTLIVSKIQHAIDINNRKQNWSGTGSLKHNPDFRKDLIILTVYMIVFGGCWHESRRLDLRDFSASDMTVRLLLLLVLCTAGTGSKPDKSADLSVVNVPINSV